MASSYGALIKGVIAALKDETDVTDIVSTRIYSSLPQNETFPYCVVSVNSSPEDTKSDVGMLHSLQISVFDRGNTFASLSAAQDAIYDLFHRQEGNITAAGFTVSMCHFANALSLKESDGMTMQTVINFNVVVQ